MLKPFPLRTTIELYLEDIKKYPETVSSPISTEEFIEFLKDTEPEWYKTLKGGLSCGRWRYTRYRHMPKVPSTSSRDLTRLMEKEGRFLLGRGRQTTQFIRGFLRAEILCSRSNGGKKSRSSVLQTGSKAIEISVHS